MDKNEVSYVRCLKCRKVLQCSHKDISALLQHIRTDHPEVEIVNSDSKDEIPNMSKRNKHRKGNEENQKEKENSFRGSENSNCRNKLDKKRDSQKIEDEERIPLLCQCTPVNQENQENQKHKGFKRKQTTKHRGDRLYKKRAQQTIEQDEKSPLLSLCSDEHETCQKPISQEENPCDCQATACHLIDQNDDKPCDSLPEPEQKQSINDECVKPSSSVNVIFTKRLKVNNSSITSIATTRHSKKKRSMYCSTIERWRPGWGTIYCPQCGSNKSPIVKSRTEQLTENQWFACCLFSCWPFCFLPCLKTHREIEYLHCSYCDAFLGVYNPKQNCLKPNREYVKRKKRDDTVMNDTMNEISNINCNSDNQEFAGILPVHRSQRTRKKNLPSIVINGRELHPDMVARLQRYRKYGELAGIDLSAVASDEIPEEKSDSSVDSVSNEKKES